MIRNPSAYRYNRQPMSEGTGPLVLTRPNEYSSAEDCKDERIPPLYFMVVSQRVRNPDEGLTLVLRHA